VWCILPAESEGCEAGTRAAWCRQGDSMIVSFQVDDANFQFELLRNGVPIPAGPIDVNHIEPIVALLHATQQPTPLQYVRPEVYADLLDASDYDLVSPEVLDFCEAMADFFHTDPETRRNSGHRRNRHRVV